MVTVRIGGNRQNLDDADASWINQQINHRRAAGELVCVQVQVKTNALNLMLSTPTCSGGGGGGRQPTPHEREVFELWEKRGMNSADFTGGNLVAFLTQLKRLV